MTNVETMRLVIAEARAGMPADSYRADLERITALADEVASGDPELLPQFDDGTRIETWGNAVEFAIGGISSRYADSSAEAVLLKAARLADLLETGIEQTKAALAGRKSEAALIGSKPVAVAPGVNHGVAPRPERIGDGLSRFEIADFSNRPRGPLSPHCALSTRNQS